MGKTRILVISKKTLCLGLILFIGLFLVSFTSSASFDNFKYEKDKTFDSKDVAGNVLLEKYKPIEIKNMFGLGSILFEGYIDKHDESCGIDCESIIKVRTQTNTPLIDEVIFRTLQKDGSWVEQPIKDYQFYINTGTQKVDVKDYEKQCINIENFHNGTIIQDCQRVLVGSHKEDTITWTPYNVGDEIEGGTYEIKLIGEKNPSKTVDWIIKTNGEWLNEWAVWGSTTLFDDIVFYYPFNESTGVTASDVTGNYDATLINMENEDWVAGKVGNGLKFDGINEFINTTFRTNIALTNNFTIALWMKIETPTITTDNNLIGSLDGNSEIRFQGSGVTFRARMIDENINTNNVDTNDNTIDGNWHLLIISRNDTSYQYWVDGANGKNQTHTMNTNIDFLNKAFYIGAVNNKGTASGFLNATIDEVAYWNRTLSAGDIKNLWNDGDGITFDTPIPINITLQSPSDNGFSGSLKTTFNATAVSTNIKNMSLFTNETGNWVEYNETIGLAGAIVSQSWNRTYNNGDRILWNVRACDTDDICNFATSNYTFEVDATAPAITLQYPTGTINYGAVGQSETLNVTFTDTNLANCWYNYNGTNITIDGCVSGVKNSTTFTLESDNLNMTIWANDTIGNYNSTFVSWNYNITLVDSYYNPTTISGAINPFNITINSSSQVTVAYLNYQGADNLGSISSDGSTYYIDKDKVAPGVEVTTNITFYWNLTFANGVTYSFPEQNQSVSPITINSTCTGMYSIYNLTLVDELTQIKINGTSHNSSIKIDLDLYTSDRSTHLKDYYTEFKQTNPAAFCIDNNLSYGEEYSLDLQIQYVAVNYSTEIYNIYNFILNSSSLNQNITLYDLPTANAQNFKLLVRDTSYLPIEGALVEIQRKYIENGTFLITEIPKTDAEGLTSASLQLNDVIYKFNIYDSGVLISSFNNVLAICQTPLVSTCTIDFNSILTGIDIPNYEYNEDFNFTLGYNSSIKTVTSTFLISSGEPSTILLEVIREDSLGTAVCQDTLTSASGTLSCVIPVSFGNSTVLARIYKSGIEQGRGNIKLDQDSSDIFGPILVILSLFVMLTLVGIGISDNPIISGVFLFVGVLLLFAMNLVSNSGFIGATSTFLFLGIAIILIIIKAGRRT